MTKPKPDSKEWWQEVAQGLGVKLFEANERIATLEAALEAAEQRGAARGPQWQLLDATSKVTRIEVIDHRQSAKPIGRVFTSRSCRVEMFLQDDERTLKVFVDSPLPSPPQAASSTEEGA